MSNLEIAHCRIHTLERLRGITAREHELFHNRTNTFWVWESILLAGYGWSRTVDILKFLIPIFGSACHASVGADRTHNFSRSVVFARSSSAPRSRIGTRRSDPYKFTSLANICTSPIFRYRRVSILRLCLSTFVAGHLAYHPPRRAILKRNSMPRQPRCVITEVGRLDPAS